MYIEPERKLRFSFKNTKFEYGFGVINLADFVPFPKNPIISSFFRQIQYAEELGSGFKKIAKYAKVYFGTEPVIQEKDIFRFEVPFGAEMLDILNRSSSIVSPTDHRLGEKLGYELDENRMKILRMMKQDKHVTILKISEKLGANKGVIESNISYLRKNKLIERIGPAKGGSWGVLHFTDSTKQILSEKLGNRLGKRLGENRMKILKMIENNATATISEMSEKLKISKTAVEKNIKYLKDNKLIERIGPAKGGLWKVLK